MMAWNCSNLNGVYSVPGYPGRNMLEQSQGGFKIERNLFFKI